MNTFLKKLILNFQMIKNGLLGNENRIDWSYMKKIKNTLILFKLSFKLINVISILITNSYSYYIIIL